MALLKKDILAISPPLADIKAIVARNDVRRYGGENTESNKT